MWKTVRILILLLILAVVAGQQLMDRFRTQSWKETLWVGVYPLNADGSQTAQRYIEALKPQDFADIEAFLTREGHRYGLTLETPVHIELYPQGDTLPPVLPPDPGTPGIAWWSLKLRWFAWRHSHFAGHAPSRIRIFVLYHDPSTLERVPDSHGLQKGLMGVVHAYADDAMTGSNGMVIAHEFLHTVGASDKYDLGDGAPLYPQGYANPDQRPLYPQEEAEIMAGRRAVSATEFEIPKNLRHVVVGPATALEIRWTQP
ncbi:MAG: hypothetical protein JSS29_18310 [Proteobacteria bacterium]|nr:hypothetical protein [Pseudomonadota bacterium]